jgi:uncharacterized glyoxalase superfamily protein PhnB
VFQLECTGDIPDAEGDPDVTWIEFRIGNGVLVLWGGGGTIGTDTPIVHVEDLDAHLAHARSAGATIVTPISEHGFRGYTALDCEGRHWQFMQAGPRIGHGALR